jgi:hypothetical protein
MARDSCVEKARMSADFESALRVEIASLEERRTKLTSELARIDGQLSGLQRALSLYRGETSGPPFALMRASRETKAPDPAKSESWAYVLRLLEDAPDSGLSVDEIADQCATSGYSVARNTLLANLSNASRDGTIQRVRTGYYKKRANGSGIPTEREDPELNEPSDEEPRTGFGYSERAEN